MTRGSMQGAVAGACMAVGCLMPAPELAAQFEPGVVTPDVVSRFDATLSYAIYLPSDYRPDSPWPVVLLMDPRGRALAPLERMREPAERLGYILMSSYDTRSDGPPEPNDVAVEAMIEDAQDLFTVDIRRLYFVGFSGTARVAWIYASRLAEYTSGVIGFGAGLPTPTFLLGMEHPARGASFAFFGGAGDRDFNYEEVRELDETLDDHGVAHLFDFYRGPHAWPDPATFAHALEWMELRAVGDGLREASAEEVERLRDVTLERARAREETSPEEAERIYRALAEALGEATDVGVALERAEALSERATKEREALDGIIDRRADFDRRFGAWLREVRSADDPFDVGDAVETLDLDAVRARAQVGDDPEARTQVRGDPEALAARRMLENVFVRAVFYEPSELVPAREFGKAAAFYELARFIHPDHPTACMGLAGTLAQRGDEDRAFEALGCAARSGAIERARFRSDPLLEPLRDDPRFDALMATIG